MCTVTFYPTDRGYILTHNRDERPSRSPQALTIEKENHKILIYPRDQQAHGTWIFIHSNGMTACLLNGAFQNHIKQADYRMSRGKVMMELAHSKNVDSWLKHIHLDRIEPFTLIIIKEKELIEMVWDGHKKHLRSMGMDIPSIWSSSTLYTSEIKLKRKQIFYQWIDNMKDYDPAAWMQRFHEIGSIGDIKNNITMCRPDGPRTVSTTQVIVDQSSYAMRYHDLLNNSLTSAHLKAKKISIKKAELMHI
jgi:hypothetical protein